MHSMWGNNYSCNNGIRCQYPDGSPGTYFAALRRFYRFYRGFHCAGGLFVKTSEDIETVAYTLTRR